MTDHKLILSKPSKHTFCTIQLTGSKSESNRALILNALSKGKVAVKNLSSADDTVTLDGILRSRRSEAASSGSTASLPVVDIGPAGTAMRFLTAYFATTGQQVIITGTERMKQRPIGILVDALKTLGSEVEYVEKPGFPPLKFGTQFRQASKQVDIQGNISSQFITALLLVAASLPEGLQLNIVGDLTSRPYVEMTLAMLQEAGISHHWQGSSISIPPQEFKASVITVEPDWSAASYWYAIAALSEASTITLPYLKQNSLQGDSRISEIMESFGITTRFTDKGLELSKNSDQPQGRFFDLKDCPDLAQTVIVCSAALGHNATFTGLETLKIKETDRVAALQNELAKIGVALREDNQVYHLDCNNLHFPEKITVKTYEDHRMAMAFAPLALKVEQVEIEEPGVVGKSYPSFWEDLKKAGFILS